MTLGGLLDAVLDRSIVFSFDRTGYLRHRERFHPGDLDVDLSGRIVLVTGAVPRRTSLRTSGRFSIGAGVPGGTTRRAPTTAGPC